MSFPKTTLWEFYSHEERGENTWEKMHLRGGRIIKIREISKNQSRKKLLRKDKWSSN